VFQVASSDLALGKYQVGPREAKKSHCEVQVRLGPHDTDATLSLIFRAATRDAMRLQRSRLRPGRLSRERIPAVAKEFFGSVREKRQEFRRYS
jgi:hypothetical protein